METLRPAFNRITWRKILPGALNWIYLYLSHYYIFLIIVFTKVWIQDISQKENIIENGCVAGENIEFHLILDNNQANRPASFASSFKGVK